MRHLLVWGVLSLAAQAVAAGCAEWNTRGFFESATLEQLEGCLDAGAEVNARDGSGFTPLHNAAGWSANPAIIETLVAAGAEVNARDGDGDTPLHNAARFNDNPAVITALLDAGADAAARDDDDKIPWDYARNRARLKDPGVWRLNGLSPVAQASAADPESRSLCARWNTLDFFEAATLEQVVECLAAEAGVNARDEYGRTPLHYAALASTNPALIAALIDAGAEVDARDGGGWTPLHDAAESNSDSTIVAALLAAGARVNARDGHSWTPLHFAARFSSSPGVIAALLDAGADAAARDDDGKIPWDYAREREGLHGTDAYWRLNEGRFR